MSYDQNPHGRGTPPARDRQAPPGRAGQRPDDLRRPGAPGPASGGRVRTSRHDPNDQSERREGVPATVFYLCAAFLAVVVLVVGAFWFVGSGGGNPSDQAPGRADSGPAPAVYSDAPSTPTFDAIGERSADRAPLTADEVFPRGRSDLRDSATHARLQLREQRVDNDCSQAVWGATAGAELRKAGCTQALRGVYSDEKKGYAAVFAVFNLAHSVDAGRFVHVITPGTGAGFVRPPAAPAPLESFGKGFGMARGAAMGHYAVVVWVQRLDGSGNARDQSLISLLVTAGNAPAVYGRVAAQR